MTHMQFLIVAFVAWCFCIAMGITCFKNAARYVGAWRVLFLMCGVTCISASAVQAYFMVKSLMT